MSNNPFLDNMKMFMDFQNLVPNMKNIPNFDMSNMLNMVKKNSETMSNIGQLTVENMQALARRNAEIAQKAGSDAFNAMKDIASSNNPENAMAKQQQYIKNAFENVISDTKELAEMATKSAMEVFNLIGNKINENMNDCLNQASNNPKKKSA